MTCGTEAHSGPSAGVKERPTPPQEPSRPDRTRGVLQPIMTSALSTERSDIVILSNRLPVHQTERDGKQNWEISPGGLVSAMTPILRDHECIWIGWAGTSTDGPEPFTHSGIHNVPITLSEQELEGYYDGFSNRTLWPLYHDAIRPPEFNRRWWSTFVEVNRRFAHAAVEHVSPGGLVWVHDYHLQLVPAMIRRKRPDVRIGFFLHIPFPPQELFAQLPRRAEILRGMLGADVVGFQTRTGAQNFCRLSRRFTSTGGRGLELRFDSRRIQAREFPISIDFKRFESLAQSPSVIELARNLRERLNGVERIILGVDRMDYTKGIELRLRAFQELLRSNRVDPAKCVFVQVGVPSRERVGTYRDIRASIEEVIGQINGEFGELGVTPVHYLYRSLPVEELVSLYCAADIMMVTPLRDGMNLVAKEYVATRVNNDGVLLLSEFTGAARSLRSALLVNPHDDIGLQDALEKALNMPLARQRQAMKSLRRVVQRHDVYTWAREFFGALAA